MKKNRFIKDDLRIEDSTCAGTPPLWGGRVGLCFYFQVHQPFRIRNYDFNEIGVNHFYEDYEKNFEILNKVADKCYLPTNAKMLELIERHNGKFRISYSISGVALEQTPEERDDGGGRNDCE